MCLIIHRPAGKLLDKEKFITAVKNNPDGYGLCVPDDGLLYVQKSDPSLDTDAEELYNTLHTDFKDEDILLHLRYTTAGDTSLRNAHPFPICEMGADGVDIRMAHNGTISKYRPAIRDDNSWESDTRVFARKYARPLLKRMVKGVEGNVLEDTFVETLLSDQIPNASVLVFMDGNGNTMKVNAEGNGGFTDEDGIYYSNKYSFNPGHREPANNYNNYGTTYSNSTYQSQQNKELDMSDTQQKKFTGEFGKEYDVADLKELFKLSDETIEEIVDNEEAAALLIKELLAASYQLSQAKDKLTAELKTEGEKRKKTEKHLYDANQRIEGQAKWIRKAKEAKKEANNGKAA